MVTQTQGIPDLGGMLNAFDMRKNVTGNGAKKMSACNLILGGPGLSVLDSFLAFFCIARDMKIHFFIIAG